MAVHLSLSTMHLWDVLPTEECGENDDVNSLEFHSENRTVRTLKIVLVSETELSKAGLSA